MRPNTCNNCSQANLTKAGFGNGEHYFTTVFCLFHSCYVLTTSRLASFWSFHLCTTMAFPNMWAFILACFWCQRPLSKIEGLPGLAFSTTKPCTSFKCLVNNHLAQYVIMQVPTLHFHFDPTFVHFLSFWAQLGAQGGADG